MDATCIYWMTRCGELKDALMTIGGVSVFFAIATTIAAAALALLGSFDSEGTGDEMHNRMRAASRRAARYAISLFLVSAAVLVARCLVPTTRDLAAILVIPKIAASETARELGEDVVTLAKEWLEELRPKAGTQR